MNKPTAKSKLVRTAIGVAGFLLVIAALSPFAMNWMMHLVEIPWTRRMR